MEKIRYDKLFVLSVLVLFGIVFLVTMFSNDETVVGQAIIDSSLETSDLDFLEERTFLGSERVIDECEFVVNRPGTYILDRDLSCGSKDGILIDSGGVNLECRGHTIIGEEGSMGIEISSHTDITVSDCVVRGFNWGISLVHSEEIILRNNYVNDNSVGISLFVVDGSLLQNNVIEENEFGFFSYFSSDAYSLEGNLICNNLEMDFICSGGNTAMTGFSNHMGTVDESCSASEGFVNLISLEENYNCEGELWEVE